MRKLLCLTSVLLAFCATNGFAGPFDEIVVFGDSLSDNGNLLFFEEQPEPDPQVYYQGRFSNGPVWVEYLAEPQRLDAPLTDFAIGGAQTSGFPPPSVGEQVTAYIATADRPLSPQTIYIIWIGANDYLNGDGDFQDAVANINHAMDDLAQFGAMHILVLNLPDLGTIPETLVTQEAAQATAFTVNFNAELGNMLDRFRVEQPQINLYEFDTASFFIMVRSDPTAFGFSNVTDPSPNFDVPNNFDGAGHLFWDDKHPTTRAHALLADHVFADLDAQVPQSDNDDDFLGGSASSSCFIMASGL